MLACDEQMNEKYVSSNEYLLLQMYESSSSSCKCALEVCLSCKCALEVCSDISLVMCITIATALGRKELITEK